MTWSLNEIEGLSRKAARGAGLSWGLAEEAGKATRWLCAAGLPGAEALAGLLRQNDGAEYETLCPLEDTGTWAAKGGALCPLISGAAICDHAKDIAEGKPLELGETSFPLLLLPYVAAAAQENETTLKLEWPGVTVTFGAETCIKQTIAGALDLDCTKAVRIALTSAEDIPPLAPITRGDIDPEIAQVLSAFAHRTYAPDTAQSRLAGAGAGLSDND
ncbi:hypothetical protein ROG8370_01700 [Roseovarius gaetbuli]|uniref:DUF3726 domain-containing protein n=1 Tax=Roseovarius gaetbuli TaxID=1356575 RepID=A0A1X6Z547_9RHOB|nr:DUF3726 domain-containing protein [Roseovarius gaetbuli]SLN40817.1 hypothetical protein ROG8370_01700 [Roseovarius gaetbuli]